MEAAPQAWPALGVLLMRDGFVSKEELLAILDEQNDTRQQRLTGRRLGEILIERGVVTPTDVAKLVAEQYELPFVELEVSDIDLNVARLLTEELARRYTAVAISSRPDGSVLLAIGDPGTVVFSDELRRAIGAAPRFAVVGPDAIESALEYVYRQAAPSPHVVHTSEDGVVVELHPSATMGTAPAEHEGELYLGTQRTAAHLWPPLGALLVREGLISDAELEAALAQQRLSANRRLGEILVDRGSVTREAVARLVAEQYELPYVDFSTEDLDPHVSALLPEEVARRYTSLPIRFLPDGSVQVVVADPTNVLHSDEIHRSLGRPLSVAVAAPGAIEAALEAVYRQVQIIPLPPLMPPAAPTDEPEAEASVELAEADDSDESARPFAEDLAEVLLAETTVADAWSDEAHEHEEPASEEAHDVVAADEEPTFAAVSWLDPEELELSVGEDHELALTPATIELAPHEDLEAAEATAVPATDGTAEEAPEFVEVPDIFGYFPPLPEAVEPVRVGLVEEEAPAEPEVVADEVVERSGDLETAIERALELGASSIHFSPQADELVVRARVDGVVRELARMPRATTDSVAEALPADGVETQVVETIHGERLTLHVHVNDETPTTLENLGFAPDVGEAVSSALEQPGVVLVAGPARSGTSTTLYAALDALNTPERVLMTIEDPVERPIAGVDQVEVDEAAGVSFARGLRFVLRADPDAVLVSELGDDETVGTVFEAARAGHVVLSALRAPSTATAVTRVLATGLDPELVASTLSAVISQRLVRRVCPSCREGYYATDEELENLGRTQDERGLRLLARGRGCDSCNHTGFRGLVAVVEALPLTEEIRSLIAEQPSAKRLHRAAVDAGMRTLQEDGIRLCLEGVTTADEVQRVVGTATG